MTSHHHRPPRFRECGSSASSSAGQKSTPNPKRRTQALLDAFPDSLPLQERVTKALQDPSFPGGVGWNVLTFLSGFTLKNQWDPENAQQTARLQIMVTRAIGGNYKDWLSFLKEDLHPYLEGFGFVRFVDGRPIPVTAAESESPRA